MQELNFAVQAKPYKVDQPTNAVHTAQCAFKHAIDSIFENMFKDGLLLTLTRRLLIARDIYIETLRHAADSY